MDSMHGYLNSLQSWKENFCFDSSVLKNLQALLSKHWARDNRSLVYRKGSSSFTFISTSLSFQQRFSTRKWSPWKAVRWRIGCIIPMTIQGDSGKVPPVHLYIQCFRSSRESLPSSVDACHQWPWQPGWGCRAEAQRGQGFAVQHVPLF